MGLDRARRQRLPVISEVEEEEQLPMVEEEEEEQLPIVDRTRRRT